ncbi:MAG: mechanosensitive ion channel domain-containing protein [Fimbriimonadaceae bacterium]
MRGYFGIAQVLFAFLFFSGLFCLTSSLSTAQILPGTPADAPEAPAQTEDPQLASPRAAFENFIRVGENQDWARATKFLDLGFVLPAARQSEGERLAKLLYGSLIRTSQFDPARIEAAEGADNLILWRYRDAEGDVFASIELAKGDDGGWRFSQPTLERVPTIWASVRDQPVIGDFVDIEEGSADIASFVRRDLFDGHPWVDQTTLGLANSKWIALGLALAFALVAGWIVREVFVFIVKAWDRRSPINISRKVYGRMRRWLLLAVFFIVLSELSKETGVFSPAISGFVVGMLQFAASVAVTFLVFAFADLVSERIELSSTVNEKGRKMLAPLVNSAIRIFGVMIGLGLILTIVGMNLTAIIASLGITGALLALAAKNSVENLFGSVTVAMDAPFDVGDWIKINNIEGTVESISLRATRVRTFHDTLITIPNMMFTTTPVENYSARRARRYRTILTLSFETDMHKVEEFCTRLQQRILGLPKVISNNTLVGVDEISPRGINIMIRAFLDVPNEIEEVEMKTKISTISVELAEEMGLEIQDPPIV